MSSPTIKSLSLHVISGGGKIPGAGQILFPLCTALLLLLLTSAQARPPSLTSDSTNSESSPHSSQLNLNEQLKDRILEELGFHQPISSQILASNISKEEYLRAYSEYMANVRRRKQQSRAEEPLSAGERRRKAQILVQSLYPLRARGMEMTLEETMMTLEFDTSSLKFGNRDGTRVKDARLFAPANCYVDDSTGIKTNPNVTNESFVSINLGSTLSRWLEKLRLKKMSKEDGYLTEGEDENELFKFSLMCSNSSHLSYSSHPSSSFRLEVVSLEKPVPPRHRRGAHGGISGGKYRVVDFSDSKDSRENELRDRKIGKKNSIDCVEGKHGKACCRKSLTVTFEDLKIGGLIIAPRQINLDYCEGRCNGRRLPYASNHAIFQNMIARSQQGKQAVPKLCCAPTKLDDLDVIQLDPSEPSGLKVTVIHNARVKECGCA